MGELERSGQNTSAYCLAWTAIRRIFALSPAGIASVVPDFTLDRICLANAPLQRDAQCDRELRVGL